MFPIPMIMERSERFRDYVDDIVQKATAKATEEAAQAATQAAAQAAARERTLLRKIVSCRFPELLPMVPPDDKLSNLETIQTLADDVLAAKTPEEALRLFGEVAEQ